MIGTSKGMLHLLCQNLLAKLSTTHRTCFGACDIETNTKESVGRRLPIERLERAAAAFDGARCLETIASYETAREVCEFWEHLQTEDLVAFCLQTDGDCEAGLRNPVFGYHTLSIYRTTTRIRS
jgi:hypothetical protein